VQIQFFC